MPQNRAEFFQCTCPVAERMFHARGELSKGAVIFWNEKEGVIAKAAAAPQFAHDDTVAVPFDHRLNLAFGIRERRGAHVVGGRSVVGKGR